MGGGGGEREKGEEGGGEKRDSNPWKDAQLVHSRIPAGGTDNIRQGEL